VSTDTFLFIGNINTGLSAIVVFLSLYKFSKREIYIKLIGLLFFIGFICDITALVLGKLGQTQYINFPQSIYDFILILLTCWIYYIILKGRYKWMIAIGIIIVIFFFVNIFFIQKESINSYNKFLSSGFIILYCIFYFYNLMVELPINHIQRMPMFWFNSAFLIYHAGTVFLFAFISYIIQAYKDDILVYWSFHNMLNILQQLIIVVGLSYDLGRLKASPKTAS
jgi:hypothetical protein